MAFLLDHFGGEVLGSAAVGLAFLGFVLEEVGPAEVSEFDSAVLVEEDVFGFDVAVDDWGIE